jgi:4-amino-4-deoxy-L-arabinose transferase-like glycosyltransferase
VTSVARPLPRLAVRRRLRSAPLVLWILLAIAAVHGSAWAFITTPFNGPDEVQHIAYVQSVAETGDGPERNSGSGGWSSEVNTAAHNLDLFAMRGNPAMRPDWERVDDVEALVRGQARDNTTGPNSAAVNPPLYYAYAAVFWKLSPDGSLFGRIASVRLATVALMVIAVLLAWMAASEVFTRTWPRFVATALVALQPKLAHTAGQVNPDLLLVVMATAFLVAALRLVNRGSSLGRLAALGAAAAGGMLTHPRGLYLLPATLVVLAVVAIRERPAAKQAIRAVAGVGALLLVGFVSAYAYSRAHAGGAAFGGNAPSASGFKIREFFSYLWQFYLPKYGFFTAEFGPPGGYGYRQFFIETFFGSYGHFEVNFVQLVYDRLQIAAFLGLIGLYTAVVLRFRRLLRRWPVVVVLVAPLLGMLAQLHVTSYASLRDDGIDVVITGRYLLPAIALYGIAAAFTVGSLPRRFAAPAAGVLLGAAVLLCLGAMGLGLARFDA